MAEARDESREFEELSQEFRKFQQEMKDPLVVGALLSRLHEERRNTNIILKQILGKLDAFESRIRAFENSKTSSHVIAPILSEVDEDIVDFVKSRKRVVAEDVATHFKYRGTNGASARLNRLVALGLLEKAQAGRKMVFLPKSR
ncbi:MAG TPA: hypothetical protein VGQ00_02285 [Candidatus Norongarragalinales archaeon]|jgi:hypothetical protein|nr:hypothetical protein [Candidatus Norongarragalinales archaeon]